MVLRSGKVRKAEVMCHSSALCLRGLLAGPGGTGATAHHPGRLTYSGAHLLFGQEIFPFFLFPCIKGQEKNISVYGKNQNIRFLQLNCTSDPDSWIQLAGFTHNSSTRTLMFLEKSSFQNRTLSLGVIGVKINKWPTNGESRKRFLKSRVHVKKWTQFTLPKDLSFLLRFCMLLLESKLGKALRIVRESALALGMSLVQVHCMWKNIKSWTSEWILKRFLTKLFWKEF